MHYLISLVFLLVIGAIGLGLYFAPYLLAKKRQKKNAEAILLLDFLLGWTILGWIAALVWAATND